MGKKRKVTRTTRLDRQIHINVNAKERIAIRKYARANLMSVSEAVRTMIRKETGLVSDESN